MTPMQMLLSNRPVTASPLHPRSLHAIAYRLRRLRMALEMRPVDICAATGVAPNTWSQWEGAKRRPSLDEALRLSDALGVTIDWLYTGNASGLPLALATKLSEKR